MPRGYGSKRRLMVHKKEAGFLTEVGATYKLLAGSRLAWITAILLLLVPVVVIICDLLGVGLGFISVNMTRILGYEFAFIVGLVGTHMAAWCAAYAARRRIENLPPKGPFVGKEDPRRYLLGTFWGSVLFIWLMLFLPLALICIYDAVRTSVVNCDYPHGFAHYLLIPYISTWIGSAIGFFGGIIFKRPLKAYLFFLAIFILSLLYSLSKVYFGPTVVIHEAFTGMILLPMYGYKTEITTGYLLGRLLIIFWTALIVNLGILACGEGLKKCGLHQLRISLGRMGRRLPEWQMIWFALVVIITVNLFQGPLGIEHTRAYIEKVLDGEVRTEHFIIRYPSQSQVGKSIDIITESHEFFYHQITDYLEIDDGPVIRSYVYPSEPVKVQLTGADASVYAKPWNAEIHMVFNPDGEIQSLKHELTHVIARVYNRNIFRVPFNLAFAEGLAEGVNWMPQIDLTADQCSAAFRRERADGSKISPASFHYTPIELFESNVKFNSGITMANYFVAASFTRYLIATYGVDLYIEAYRRADPDAFEPIYGKSLDALSADWETYIDAIPLDDGALDYIEYMFGLGPFSKLECAHTIAKHALAARQYKQMMQYDKAMEEYKALIANAPGNIQWGYGLLNTLYLSGDYEDALIFAPSLFDYPDISATWEHLINLRVGDCHARSGDITSAIHYYGWALDKAVTQNQVDSANLKIYATGNPEMLQYLLLGGEQPKPVARWYYEKAAQASPDDFLPPLLIASTLISERIYDEALPYVDTALGHEIPISSYETQLHYYRGVCLFRAGRYDEAKLSFNEAIRIETEIFTSIGRNDSVYMEIYRNWLDRCEWRKTWTPPEIE